MWTLPPLVIVQEVQICLFQRVPSSNAIQLVCAHGSVVHAHAARGACVRSGLLQRYTVSLKRLPPAWDAYTHWRLLSCLGTAREQEGNTHFCFFRRSGLNVTLYLKMWNVHERYTCCTSCPREWLAFGEDKKTTKRAPTVPSKLLPILRPSVAS